MMSVPLPLDISGTAAEHLSFVRESIAREELWRATVPVEQLDAAYAAVRERARARFEVMIWSDPTTPCEELLRYVADEGMEEDWPLPSVSDVLDRRRIELQRRADAILATVRESGLDESTAERARELSPDAFERALSVSAPRQSESDIDFRCSRSEAWEHQSRERSALGLEPASEPAIIVFAPAAENLLLQYMVRGSDLEPSFSDFAAVLASWRARFGATLQEWRGGELILGVARPPVDLEPARAAAFEHFLMCPGNRLGRLLTPDRAEHRLYEIMSNVWLCGWFAG